MRYYKILTDNRPTVIGVGKGGVEITKDEYDHIKAIIDARPSAPDGFAYRLTENLGWELYELPPVEAEEELTEAEALDILLGGAV